MIITSFGGKQLVLRFVRYTITNVMSIVTNKFANTNEMAREQ